MKLDSLTPEDWNRITVRHSDDSVTIPYDGTVLTLTVDEWIDALTDYACTPRPDFSRVTQMVELL